MKSFFLKKNQYTERAFTLIELMVSLTVFSIVMLVSIGTTLIMIDANAKAQTVYAAATNLSFALDSMTRDIRTGFHYYCFDASDCLSELREELSEDDPYRDCRGTVGENALSFKRESDSRQVAYRHNTANNSIEYIDVGSGSNTWERLTAQEIVIEELEFIVYGSQPYGEYDEDGDFREITGGGSGGDQQPIIDLFVKGYVNNGLDTDTDFSIQSHIVPRRLDID